MSCTGVNQLWQGFDIGAQQFLQSSVIKYQTYYLVLMAQLLQHFLTGDILSFLGLLGFIDDFEFVKENVAHLFRRSDIKMFSCQFVDALLYVEHALGQLLGCL